MRKQYESFLIRIDIILMCYCIHNILALIPALLLKQSHKIEDT